MIVMDCQSGYSYHQRDKQILGGCFRNREGQAAIQYISISAIHIESVRLFRRFGGGRYRQKKCRVLCCEVIDACTTSNDV